MGKIEFGKELIYRYLAGELAEDEMLQLAEWMRENKKNRQEFVLLKKMFTEISASLSEKKDNSKQAFEKFIERVENTSAKTTESEDDKERAIWVKVMQYAAMILALIGVGVGGYLFGTGSTISDDVYSEIIVPYGSKTNVILPDGSRLWLNAGSKLKYNKIFGKDSREVFLEGEAYFDVEKKKIPFIVHTSHFDIRVLGTSFNVKSYADEKHIETTLVEGHILVETNKGAKTIELRPKQKLIYDKEIKQTRVDSIQNQSNSAQLFDSQAGKGKDGQEGLEIETLRSLNAGIIESNVDVEKSISWKEGTLIFDRESLGELSRKLERKFDITIEFENEDIENYSFTGTIKDFPLEQVLEALKLTSKIRYKIKGKVVKLY